jgi:hypothetical protein
MTAVRTATLAQAREDGRKARREGESVTANPYSNWATEYYQWLQGWMEEEEKT